MFHVKNAMMSDGSLCTLTVDGGVLVAVTAQAGLVPVGSAAVALPDLGEFKAVAADGSVDAQGLWLVPGMVDVHVHSRDPGHPEKETWATLASAAYKGGVVALCDMPNTKPPTLERDDILDKMARAQASGLDYRLYLAVTAANLDHLAPLLADPFLPLCGLKVYYGTSTGGHTFSDLPKLASALRTRPEALIAFHSEDQCTVDDNESQFLPTGGDFSNPAAFAVHSVIRSSAAALTATRTILRWAEQHQRPIHIAHVSTAAEVMLIQSARARGVRVTSEVAPHHLLLSTADYARLGALIKINPPVRSPEEVTALGECFGRREIECFATDHAPHTLAEKKRLDYHACPSGAPAIEFFAPLLFKAAAQYGLSRAAAAAMGTEIPARIFGFRQRGSFRPGQSADWVWLSSGSYKISASAIRSRCGWTPYEHLEVPVQVEATWHRGHRVYQRE